MGLLLFRIGAYLFIYDLQVYLALLLGGRYKAFLLRCLMVTLFGPSGRPGLKYWFCLAPFDRCGPAAITDLFLTIKTPHQMKHSELKNIQRWEMPSNYYGNEYHEYYVVYSHHRDSDILTESNWDYIVKALGGESDTVTIQRSGHWAVGWIELLMIHESDMRLLLIAEDLISSIKYYPILDDEDYCQRECEAKQWQWESMELKQKIELCSKASISIFAGRAEFAPMEVMDYLEA